MSLQTLTLNAWCGGGWAPEPDPDIRRLCGGCVEAGGGCVEAVWRLCGGCVEAVWRLVVVVVTVQVWDL